MAVSTRPAAIAFTDAAARAAVDAVIAAAAQVPDVSMDIATARRVVDVALAAAADALHDHPDATDIAYFVIDDTHPGFPREGRDSAGAAYAVCSSALLEMLRELADPDFRRRWDLGAAIGPADGVAQYARDELPGGWPEHAAPTAIARSVLRAATTAILEPSSGADFAGGACAARRLVARALPAACAAMQREHDREAGGERR